mmetsp:Transcript_107847/g.220134  ORF Transcript_107847/g.220134 Transcript_107847/m.220134 type:complete len:110 (+) Transcript_107847:2-331(+)
MHLFVLEPLLLALHLMIGEPTIDETGYLLRLIRLRLWRIVSPCLEPFLRSLRVPDWMVDCLSACGSCLSCCKRREEAMIAEFLNLSEQESEEDSEPAMADEIWEPPDLQ